MKHQTYFKNIFFLLLIAVSLLGQVCAKAADTARVYVIKVNGIIDLGLSGFMKRALQTAKDNQAQAVILVVDTFGGRVDAVTQICRYINEAKPTPVISYVDTEAWSAGALICLATQKIFMAPGASIGSAEPKLLGLGGAEADTDEKTVSALRAKFKATAQENRHPANLAVAMVDKEVELKLVQVGKETPRIMNEQELQETNNLSPAEKIRVIKTISPKGKLLNLSAQEAKELGLAAEILPDLNSVLRSLKLEGAQPREISPTWSEALVRFLTHPIVSSLLLTLGVLGFIFELKLPHWGLSGTLGLTFLALFFWGHYLVGLANWIEILLFILGCILLILEVFVIPGFGLVGITGIALVMGSLYLALIKHPFQASTGELRSALYTLSYSIIAIFVIIIAVWRVLPHTGLFKKIALGFQEKKETGFTSSHSRDTYLGKVGKTVTSLRPAGKANFAGCSLDVSSEGDFIEKDKEVVVVKVEGNKIIVREKAV